MGDAARKGDVLAVETNSNTTHFLLVKAIDDGFQEVPDGYVCPIAEANFDGTCYGRRNHAVRAVLLRPVTTGRGEASASRYEEHRNGRELLVLCPRIRIGKIQMKSLDGPRRAAPARAAAAAATAAPPRPSVLELPAGVRAQILERCSVY